MLVEHSKFRKNCNGVEAQEQLLATFRIYEDILVLIV